MDACGVLPTELINEICSYLSFSKLVELGNESAFINWLHQNKDKCRGICMNRECDNEKLKNDIFCYTCKRFPHIIKNLDEIQMYEYIDTTEYYMHGRSVYTECLYHLDKDPLYVKLYLTKNTYTMINVYV